MTDEELFGSVACAELDAFADAAPPLDETQVVLLTALFRTDPEQAAA